MLCSFCSSLVYLRLGFSLIFFFLHTMKATEQMTAATTIAKKIPT